MLEFGTTEIYYLGGASRISKAGKYWVRKVLNDPTQKHFLIVGVFDQRDAHRIGEFIAVVRPENPKKTYFQSWDSFSLARAGKESTISIQAQRETLESLVLGNGTTVQSLTKNWSSVRNSPIAIEYFSQLMRSYSAKLVSSQTISRVAAGDKLSRVVELKDSTGKYNPGAISAQITSANSDLSQQLSFDALSLGSAQNRSGFAKIVVETFKKELIWLDRLLRFGKNSTVQAQLSRRAVLYGCKPFGYGMPNAIYTAENLSLKDRDNIRSVFFTENLLGEFSSSLSVAKNEQLRKLQPSIAKDLAAIIDVTPPNQAYSDLLDLLRTDLEELSCMIDAGVENKLVVKKIMVIKKQLRNRAANPQGWPS